MKILRPTYADFGPTLATEKLRTKHGIDLAKETVRQLQIASGLWIPRKLRPPKIQVHRITSVKSAGDRAVRLRFDNGKTYTVDLRVLVRHSRGLKALRGASLFARVALGEGGHSIAWPGDLDLGADTLWELALEQNGRTDAVEFIRWRWRNGLSLTNAAEALGLSRRQVAYYASGEHEVPRTVLLACKGWEAEQRAAA